MKLKSGLKQKLLRAILAGALLAGLLPVSAYAATVPSSGSCSMLITKPVPYGATLPASYTYNVLAILTFTSSAGGTLNYYTTHVNYATTGITMAAPATGAAVPFTYTPA